MPTPSHTHRPNRKSKFEIRKSLLTLLLLPTCTLAAPTLSLDENPNQNTSPPAQPASPSPYPTGNWFGLRDQLAKNHLSIAGLLQLDTSKTLSGGLDTNSTPTRYLLDLNITYDASHLLPDSSLFLDFQSHDGPNASTTSVGDIQGFDNIDGPHFLQIAQLWYQQYLFNKLLRLKLGKIDANADFSFIDHGTQFLHSAAAFNLSNNPFPTYPDPAPGLELTFTSPSNLYAQFGAFYSNNNQNILDFVGHPQSIELPAGGTYLITEFGTHSILTLNSQSLPTHAAIGAWYHTGEFPTLSNPHDSITGAAGAYAFLDQSLYIVPATQSTPAKDLGFFLSAGAADPRTLPIQQNLAAGLAATGFIPSRPSDILGLFTSWSHLSPTTSPTPHNSETALELFYKLQLTPYFSLKPDLQYILSPSGKYPDATVLTLRAEIDF